MSLRIFSTTLLTGNILYVSNRAVNYVPLQTYVVPAFHVH